MSDRPRRWVTLISVQRPDAEGVMQYFAAKLPDDFERIAPEDQSRLLQATISGALRSRGYDSLDRLRVESQKRFPGSGINWRYYDLSEGHEVFSG